MALTTYTLDELTDRYRALIRSLITPAPDTSPPSDWYLTARMAAVLHHGAQGMAVYLLRQLRPTQAAQDWISAWGEALGLPLRSAEAAVGVIQIEGSAGSTQGNGTYAAAPDGTRYQLTAGASLVTPGWAGKTAGAGSTAKRLVMLPSTGGMVAGHLLACTFAGGTEKRAIEQVDATTGVVDLYEPFSEAPTAGQAISPVTGAVAPVVCTTPGARGNKLPGEVLTLEAPGAGVTAATRLLEATGGGDEETLEELRTRVVAYLRDRPSAGNAGWYREQARSTPGVRLADAFVFPGYRGFGTVDVLPWGVEGMRRPGALTCQRVQDYLDSVSHWADDVLVRPFTYSAAVPVTLTVNMHAGYEPDWVGSRTLAVAAHTTTRLYLTTSPVGVIEVGDRVMVPVQAPTDTWRTYTREVSAVDPTYIEVSEALPAAPVNGEIITPGGPGVTESIEAIEALFDQLGPCAYLSIGGSVDVFYERVPRVEERSPGTLHVNAITAAVRAVEGVENATVTEPAFDTTANVTNVLLIGRVRLYAVGPS